MHAHFQTQNTFICHVHLPHRAWKELCSTSGPVQQSSEGGVRLIRGETEKRCKRQIWEGCRSLPCQPRVYFSQSSYTTVPWEAKPVETNLLKFTQDICSHTHKKNPCSFHQGQQNLQPQVYLLLLSHASEGWEVCQLALTCLDST